MSDTTTPTGTQPPTRARPAAGTRDLGTSTHLERRERFGRFGAAGALDNAAGELERRRADEAAVDAQLLRLASARRQNSESPVPA